MKTDLKKPYMSQTRLEMYARCGQQYYYRYVAGLVSPPGIAMVKGTATHAAANVNFSQKINTAVDLPISEMQEVAAASFENELGSGVLLTGDERSRGQKIVLGEAKDQVVALAEAYGEQIAPVYQPVAVEQEFRIELPGSHDLLGFIDLVDENRVVVDLKTSGKKKSQAEVDTSIQLTAYAAGHAHLFGEPCSEVRLDTLVQTTKGVQRQVLKSHRDAGDFEALAARINAMEEAIAAEIYHPAPSNVWWCSERHCGYHDRCPFVKHGG